MMHHRIRYMGWFLTLIPLAVLLAGAVGGRLGPDPAEQIMHVTGEWSLRLLILALQKLSE